VINAYRGAILLALSVTYILAGCASPAERAAQLQAREQATCERYGFQPGTDSFAQCMMQIDQANQNRRAALAAAYMQSSPLFHPAPPPITTTCSSMGGMTTCNTR